MSLKHLFSLSVFFLAACGAQTDPPITDPLANFEVIDCDVAFATSIEEPVFEAIDSPQRFRELYLATDLNNQDEVPEVNFEDSTVVAIHLGMRPSTGYSAAVTSVQESGTAVMVHYEESTPGNCGAGAAVTYPYCFVAIEKTDKPVEFEGSETTDCVNP